MYGKLETDKMSVPYSERQKSKSWEQKMRFGALNISYTYRKSHEAW